MLNLAHSLRPTQLQDFVSQEHIIAPHSPLAKMIQHNTLAHCFFYGPPGSGKTTLAYLLAKELQKPFFNLNATNFKTEELRKIMKEHEGSLYQPLIFIDEVHRLNKAQQELLLPIMESYSAVICGASTYNPFYSLTNAIRSRSFIFELKAHTNYQLQQILNKAFSLITQQHGWTIHCDEQTQEYLINSSAGDARAMLHLLEFALIACEDSSSLPYKQNPQSDKHKILNLEILQNLRPHTLHDGSSEAQTHYVLISALIKSIRGSDVDAAIYYLARLIAGGENPEFIARRLVILASEDIGNANPHALNLATSTMNAVSKIGYPEARIILSQCVIYLASSPKSNTAYNAINKALTLINEGCVLPIVPHIMPDSKDYLYPHNYGGYVQQRYLSESLNLVEQTNKGFEKTLNEWLYKIKNISEENQTMPSDNLKEGTQKHI